MLKIVPVCGGGSLLKVLESTCGLAGRRLRLMIFFTFFSVGGAIVVSVVAVVVVVVVTEVDDGA